jgi:hypothetical protein
MEKGVRVVEREYSKKMSDLNRGFEVRWDASLSAVSPSERGLGSGDIVRVDGSENERSRTNGWSHW